MVISIRESTPEVVEAIAKLGEPEIAKSTQFAINKIVDPEMRTPRHMK